MEGPTARQLEVLRFLHRATEEQGLPPTVEEIRQGMHMASTNGVFIHLKALVFKGYLHRTSATSRQYRLTKIARHLLGLKPSDPSVDANTVAIPVLGRVAAGAPTLAVEQAEDAVRIDTMLVDAHPRELFALHIRGESMIGDGILDGDLVIVRREPIATPGQIVIALIDEEATCKRYFPEGDIIRFQPSNPKMVPLLVRKADFRSTMILGVVVGLYRQTPAALRGDDPRRSKGDSSETPVSPVQN
jgi:repressor LexA